MYIKIVHLVFCDSFNGWRNKYRGRFHLETRGDILNIGYIKDFQSQLVTKRRHRYLLKTYLWLSAVPLEIEKRS